MTIKHIIEYIYSAIDMNSIRYIGGNIKRKRGKSFTFDVGLKLFHLLEEEKENKGAKM